MKNSSFGALRMSSGFAPTSTEWLVDENLMETLRPLHYRVVWRVKKKQALKGGAHLFYIVLRQNLTPRAQWREDVLAEHLEWARRTSEAGDLVLSGPADDKKMGIYLLRAPDVHAARAIAEGDPIIAGGYCSYELLDWDIQRGRALVEAAS